MLVRYHHENFNFYDTFLGKEIRVNTGVTFCVMTEDNEIFYVGISRCSDKDQFNKKLGRRISRGRALYRLLEDKSNFKGKDRSMRRYSLIVTDADIKNNIKADYDKLKQELQDAYNPNNEDFEFMDNLLQVNTDNRQFHIPIWMFIVLSNDKVKYDKLKQELQDAYNPNIDGELQVE